MASDFLISLGLANLAAAGAVLAVLALRGPARRLFGAGIAYSLWLIVPGAMLATLVPARTILVEVSSAPVATAPVILQATADASAAPAPAQAVAAAPLLNMEQALLAVWLAGLAVSLVLLIVGQRRALTRFGRITADARDPRIARASVGAAGPALVGVFRPRLVVPHDFEERFDAIEQAMILTHERTHLASGHAPLNALAALLKAFNWFNPLIHLAARYARVDQELACDASVVARYPSERRTYAHALLKTQLASAPLPFGCSWPAGSAGRLEERLLMLAQTTPGRFRLAAGVCVIALLIAGAGCTTWTARPPQERIVEASAQAARIAPPALLAAGLAPIPATPGPAMTAQVIPEQLASPPSQQPVLELNGKTSPVLEGSWAMTSGFGDRADPFNGEKAAFHTGLDLAAPFEALVHAPAQAVVTFAGVRDDGRGRLIELDLGNSTKILFGHLNETRVKQGDRVKPGDVVGTVGSTERSSGSHLHLEYLRQGKPFDPATVKGLVFGPAQSQFIKPALIQQDKSAAQLQAPPPLSEEPQVPVAPVGPQSVDLCSVRSAELLALKLTGNVVVRKSNEVLYATQLPLRPTQAGGPVKITADRAWFADDCKSATWTGHVTIELDGVTYTSDAVVAEISNR